MNKPSLHSFKPGDLVCLDKEEVIKFQDPEYAEYMLLSFKGYGIVVNVGEAIKYPDFDRESSFWMNLETVECVEVLHVTSEDNLECVSWHHSFLKHVS